MLNYFSNNQDVIEIREKYALQVIVKVVYLCHNKGDT